MTLRPFAPRLLLVALVAALQLAPQLVMADLLALTVSSSTAPAGALAQIQADAASVLQTFTSQEGSSYGAMAAGQAATPGGVRMLRGGGEDHDEDEDEDPQASGETDLQALPDKADRRLIDCPNSCSNSGSLTCVLLGCAYCGRCRRLQAALQGLSTNKHRKIESQLGSSLTATYCQGKPGCVITAAIMRVNADGTLTTAV